MPGYDLQYNPYLIPRERKRARVQSVSGKAGIRSVSGIGAEPNLERKSIYGDALELSPAAGISRPWAGSQGRRLDLIESADRVLSVRTF